MSKKRTTKSKKYVSDDDSPQENKITKAKKKKEEAEESESESEEEVIQKPKSKSKAALASGKWVDHVKDWSKKKKITYKQALKDEGCKAAWQKKKGKK